MMPIDWPLERDDAFRLRFETEPELLHSNGPKHVADDP